jgi:DNA-binding transcriptional ArsR family regulator
MSVRFRFSSADLLRCRFATSPLFETVNAARAFVDPRQRPYLGPWWRAVHTTPPPVLIAVNPVNPVNPMGAEVPDFLSPVPSGHAPRVQDQLAGVRATPAAQVEEELRRCRDTQSDRRARDHVDELLKDPAAARDELADALDAAWRSLVLPWWPRVRELLDADIAYQSRQLAEHGLGHVVAELHEDVSWTDDAIMVRTRYHRECALDGRGLVLMPSAFVWPFAVAGTEPPWPPTLIYPARGIGELWGQRRGEAPAALAQLLGRTRALLLTDLAEPASTTALAARHGLSASGVSAHLAALHDAGLVVKRRHRHEVRYGRTALGEALVRRVMPED